MIDLFLFQNALRDFVRPKRLLAILCLAGAPVILAAIMRATMHGAFDAPLVYGVLVSFVVFGFTMVLMAVVFGTGIISQEVEQKTIVYLLTRPVARWRLLAAKYAAALFTIIVVSWITSILVGFITFGSDAIHQPALRRDLGILPVGALAYSSLFLLVSTVLNRPLLWGLLFTFGWETWVPMLPGAFRKASLMSYLRVLSPHPAPQGETMDLSELLEAVTTSEITKRLSWEVLLAVSIVSLLLAMFVFSQREYVPRDDE